MNVYLTFIIHSNTLGDKVLVEFKLLKYLILIISTLSATRQDGEAAGECVSGRVCQRLCVFNGFSMWVSPAQESSGVSKLCPQGENCGELCKLRQVQNTGKPWVFQNSNAFVATTGRRNCTLLLIGWRPPGEINSNRGRKCQGSHAWLSPSLVPPPGSKAG